MTPVDLAGMARILDRTVAPLRREIPDTAEFAIWSTRTRSALDSGLAVPPEHLWWFVERGDTVLLSDGVTHHFTSAAHVDREAGTISFADLWPEDFFLQQDCNTLGIASVGTRITRAEFARAAVGLVTWDRLPLLDAYLQAYPAQAQSAALQCRIGHMILAIGVDPLTTFAAMRFSMARDLARAAGDTALELECAARLYLSAMCGFAEMMRAGVEGMAGEMTRLLRDLQTSHAPEELEAQLKPQELARLGFCVSQVGRHDVADRAATRAIALDPGFEDSYWLRAAARFEQGRPQDALADVESFLDINDRDMAELKRQRSATHPENNIEPGRIDGAMGEHVFRRTTVLELAVRAAAQLKDFGLTAKYLHLLQALHPDRADVAARIQAMGSVRPT
jgi:tetratricopeptide (TPR) repeat protein